jgi:hypothetical protein
LATAAGQNEKGERMSTVDERKVGFTGTRHGMTPEQADEFRSWIKAIQPTEFHHGDCVGADNQAANIVREVMGRTCLIHSHPPVEKMHRAFNSHVDIIHPAKDYHSRNRDIVDATGQTIGAPLGTASAARTGGTWYTLGYAEKRGKARRIMWPNGSSSASFPTVSA